MLTFGFRAQVANHKATRPSPIATWLVIGTKPRYEAHGDVRVEYD